MPATWLVPTLFSALATLLVGLVLAYIRGIANDIGDLKLRTETMQKEWQHNLDLSLKDVRMQVGSQQEKLEMVIKDIRVQSENQQKEQRLTADKQQEQMTTLRIEMSKMQEQLYAVLRGTTIRDQVAMAAAGGTK